MSRAFNRSARERVRAEQDAWLFAAAFIAVLSGGLAWLAHSREVAVPADVMPALVLGATVIGLMTPPPVQRFLWHMLANHIAVAPPREVARPWVVDGDTIDDRATGVRYRLANVDAPETGENAKCFKERERGEAATRAAIQLVRSAKRVEVRQTWRTDRFGRRIAFVAIDGVDLGSMLVKRGLAQPWRGQRETWCGADGGLARLARSGSAPHVCQTCKAWR